MTRKPRSAPDQQPQDVAVVGGGLAGLTAAAYLAREGRAVTVYERSRALGGRARTTEDQGFRFNLGPHAFYRDGEGAAVLRDLGVNLTGGFPAGRGLAIRAGRLYRLPAGLPDLLRTDLLSARSKLDFMRFFRSLPKLDSHSWQDVAASHWLDVCANEQVRQTVEALVRLSTYSAELERMSAGAAIDQLRVSMRGVQYLDDGWQSLVERLSAVAARAGARLLPGVAVSQIESSPAGHTLQLTDGTTGRALQTIIAASPSVAAGLLTGEARSYMETWARRLTPVRAACLNVGLRTLPRADRLFAIGMDQPLYYSVHSAWAKLAPANHALIQVARYLGRGDDPDPAGIERQLDETLDVLQPGWRDQLVSRSFLPEMTVTHALVAASFGGARGRPESQVPAIPGLHLAGDWVGPQGMLADASLASARGAAAAVLQVKREALAA